MKLLVISTPVFKLMPPQGTAGYGGLEPLAYFQATGLAKRGYEVSVACPDGSDVPGCTVIPVGPERGVTEKIAYQRYWNILPGFDVIIDHSWEKWSLILKAEGRLKAPVLSVCHAPVNTMFNEMPPVEKPCFVCISKDQGAHFEALFSRPCRVAYNGIDLDWYKPTGVKRSGRFLFLARFSSIKGADLAVDACKEAGVGLDLVGDNTITAEPEFFERVKAKCDFPSPYGAMAKLGVLKSQSIDMVGPATRSECVGWFSQAHCLLHPNMRFREPFGLAPVEAMACGCPVIAWDFGAMRETIKDRETGWLVRSVGELADVVKMVQGKGPAETWDWMRNRCREWAAQFSIQRMVERYDELCKEAVDTGDW